MGRCGWARCPQNSVLSHAAQDMARAWFRGVGAHCTDFGAFWRHFGQFLGHIGQLKATRGLPDKVKSSRTCNVATVSLGWAFLDGYRGRFGRKKKGPFGAENAQVWEGTSRALRRPIVPPIVFSKRNHVLHGAYPLCCIPKRNGGVVPSLSVWGGGTTRNLWVRSSQKAPFLAPTACKRSHCFFQFWRSEIPKMDQSHHKTMFHSLRSHMEHVVCNGTCCGSSSTRGIATAIMTLHAPPVKKVSPITTEKSTCTKGGCKAAFLKGWALQSPNT